MGAAVRTFTALADPARCLVVERLAGAPCSAGELAALAGLSKFAMSRRLRVLLEAGLVADDRSATGTRGSEAAVSGGDKPDPASTRIKHERTVC